MSRIFSGKCNWTGDTVYSNLGDFYLFYETKKAFLASHSVYMCLSRETFPLLGFVFVDDAELIQSGDFPMEFFGENVRFAIRNQQDWLGRFVLAYRR